MVKFNMKKTFNFTPFSNVGDIRFESNRDEVRKIQGPFTEFRKTRFSKNTTDDFGGYHVFYSIEDKVDAVELFPVNTIVTYHGQNLFNLSKNELIKLFSDSSLKDESEHLAFDTYGIEISIEDDIVTSILVHRKGY